MEWNEIWAKWSNIKCKSDTAEEKEKLKYFHFISVVVFFTTICSYYDDGSGCMRERTSSQELALAMMLIMIIDFDETTTTQFRQNDEVKNMGMQNVGETYDFNGGDLNIIFILSLFCFTGKER